MDGMDPRHHVVEAEEEDLAVLHSEQLGRIRVQALADMLAPFHIFVHEKDQPENDRRRLEQEGAIVSEWGPSENNRRARFYEMTRAGHKLLEAEKHDWEQTAAIIARFFEVEAEDLA